MDMIRYDPILSNFSEYRLSTLTLWVTQCFFAATFWISIMNVPIFSAANTHRYTVNGAVYYRLFSVQTILWF